ncbi:Hypothetical predicted protein, partial [Mytilus galloprovincialis]
ISLIVGLFTTSSTFAVTIMKTIKTIVGNVLSDSRQKEDFNALLAKPTVMEQNVQDTVNVGAMKGHGAKSRGINRMRLWLGRSRIEMKSSYTKDDKCVLAAYY